MRRAGRLGRVLAATLLSSLALAACGATAPTPEPTPRLDGAGVCALIPDADSLVGRTTIAAPSGFTIGTVTRCLWVYDADPARNVGLNVGARSTHDDMIEAFGPGEAVPDLGDEAFWWASNRAISVVVGETAYQVDLQLESDEATRDLALALAQSVLANWD